MYFHSDANYISPWLSSPTKVKLIVRKYHRNELKLQKAFISLLLQRKCSLHLECSSNERMLFITHIFKQVIASSTLTPTLCIICSTSAVQVTFQALLTQDSRTLVDGRAVPCQGTFGKHFSFRTSAFEAALLRVAVNVRSYFVCNSRTDRNATFASFCWNKIARTNCKIEIKSFVKITSDLCFYPSEPSAFYPSEPSLIFIRLNQA